MADFAHKYGEICYTTGRSQSAGRLVIILKGGLNAKTGCLDASVWARMIGFVPASRLLSGIPVASAECAAGTSSFVRTPPMQHANETERKK